MNEEWAQKLKYLRLRNLLEHWDEYLAKGRKDRYSNERLLKYVLDQEYSSKNENARHQRRKRARIPESWELATYPFKRQPKLDRKRVVSLYDSFDYMTKIQNMAWLGPTGVGKTGLATSFMNQAIDRGYTGRFILFPELLEELYAAVADHSEKKVLKRYWYRSAKCSHFRSFEGSHFFFLADPLMPGAMPPTARHGNFSAEA